MLPCVGSRGIGSDPTHTNSQMRVLDEGVQTSSSHKAHRNAPPAVGDRRRDVLENGPTNVPSVTSRVMAGFMGWRLLLGVVLLVACTSTGSNSSPNDVTLPNIVTTSDAATSSTVATTTPVTIPPTPPPTEPPTTLPPTTTTTPPPTIDQLAAAVVQVGMWEPQASRYCKFGSGTLIHSGNVILTNYHVIDLSKGDCEADSKIAVLVEPDLHEVAHFAGYATVIASDATLDLAVLAASPSPGARGTFDGLPVATVGSSADLAPPATLTVVGFQAIGGNTKSVTSGPVAGFRPDDAVPGATWLKVETTASFGNSGGAAYDSTGHLVGIPTRVANDEGGNISLVRPIDEAAPLIQQAIATFEAEPTTTVAPPIPPTTAPPTTPVPTTTVPAPPVIPQVAGYSLKRYDAGIGNVIVSTGKVTGTPIDDVHSMPAGTGQACIFWSATNIPNDTQYQVFWNVNGTKYDAQPNGSWKGGTSQVNWCRPAVPTGLPPGHHS
ncbi:MAG: serine protease Do, partial [Ilumatobacteraceae bacterium]